MSGGSNNSPLTDGERLPENLLTGSGEERGEGGGGVKEGFSTLYHPLSPPHTLSFSSAYKWGGFPVVFSFDGTLTIKSPSLHPPSAAFNGPGVNYGLWLLVFHVKQWLQ